MEFQPSRQIATVLQWVPEYCTADFRCAADCIYGKETLTLINLLFSAQEKTTYLFIRQYRDLFPLF